MQNHLKKCKTFAKSDMYKISSSIRPAVSSTKNHNEMEEYETMARGSNIFTALG